MRPARKPVPPAAPAPELPFPPRKPPHRFSPEEMARSAIARRPTTPSGHRVKYTVTMFLRRETAEALTARAIREGKNVPGLMAELIEAECARQGARRTAS